MRKNFCNRCGKKIREEWEVCPYCGNECLEIEKSTELKENRKIEEGKEEKESEKTGEYWKEDERGETEEKSSIVDENREDEEYLLAPHLKGMARTIVNLLFKIVSVIFEVIAVIVTYSHIHSEMEAAEDYKMILYILRLLYSCGHYYILSGLITNLYDFFKIKKSSLPSENFSGIVIALEVGRIISGLLAWVYFYNISYLQLIQIFISIGSDSIKDVLIIYKESLFFIIIGVIMGYAVDKILSKEEEPAEDADTTHELK